MGDITAAVLLTMLAVFLSVLTGWHIYASTFCIIAVAEVLGFGITKGFRW